MKTTPRPGQIAILAGGAVCFIFSFFGWFKYSGGSSGSAWTGPTSSNSLGLSPLTIWPALLGLIAAGLLAAELFGNMNLPDRILGLSTNALNVALALPGLLIMFSVLIMDFGGGVSKGVGIWFSLIGAIALFAGAVMESVQDGAPGGGGGSSAAPPSPF